MDSWEEEQLLHGFLNRGVPLPIFIFKKVSGKSPLKAAITLPELAKPLFFTIAHLGCFQK